MQAKYLLIAQLRYQIKKEEYKNLLKLFNSDFNILRDNIDVNNLLVLLEKYLVTIPSLTRVIYDKDGNPVKDKYPDVSLFDHSKGSAAIANAMYNYLSEEDELRKRFDKNEDLCSDILNPDDNKYLLIGCDISGVQDFIYTISSSDALKSLRARSFYLEMLAEHIADEILDNLNLFRTNLIYIGGGGFYILSQNTKEAIDKVSQIKENINKWLLDEFGGRLYTNIEFVPFAGKEFGLNKEMNCYGIQNIWGELSNKIEYSKKTKFNNLFKEIFKVEEPHEKTRTCLICHTDSRELIDVDSQAFCSTCASLINLGGKIKSKYLRYIAKSDDEFQPDDNCAVFQIQKTLYLLCDDNTLKKQKYEKYYVINSWDISDYKMTNSTQLNIGNYYYEKAKDFESLADESDGIKNIAVLRMDVDNLGKIFTRGIHQSEANFSRMTSISRNLSLFFKFYINFILNGKLQGIDQLRISENNFGRERRVVIIYSGGDDIFIVGAWNEVAEAAVDINKCLRKYTCDNPDITLSAGITLHESGYPLYQMARLSKNAEFAAKNNVYKDKDKEKEKNSISFLYDEALKIRNQQLKSKFAVKNNDDLISQCASWEEFDKLINECKLFYKIYDVIPHSDFMKISKIIQEWQINGKLYLPMLYYILSKMKKKIINADDNSKIDSIFSKYFADPSLIKTLHIPVTWVEYLKRN